MVSEIKNIENYNKGAFISDIFAQKVPADFGDFSSGYRIAEELECPLNKNGAGVDMGRKPKEYPTEWEQVAKEKYFYRREVAKNKYEFKYRVNQKDALGNLVDTWKKINARREPFSSLKEAKAHRKAFIDEIMSRTVRSMSVPDIHTIQEIFDHYLANRGDSLAPNTINKYKGNVKTHIVPYFKRRHIEMITLGEIKNFVVKLRGKKAKETVKSVIATMAQIWKYAYEMGVIDRMAYIEAFVDTSTKATIPKMEKKNRVIIPETYTMEQLELFFDLAYQEGEVYYMLMQLCYYGGLRLSEALGLRFSNIDWDTGKITIDHQLIYNKNTNIAELTTTKSKTKRIFDAPPVLLEILQNWKIKQEQAQKRLGRKYGNKEELTDRTTGKLVKGADFVLRDSKGEILTHSKANHVRERIQKKTGVHFYYHGLRHTVVTRLGSSGVPLKNISEFIGHADTRTTQLFYLGIDEVGEEKLATAIAKL